MSLQLGQSLRITPCFEFSTSVSARDLSRLAHRTEQDPEALADAVVALESGAELTDDQASLLLESIDRSRAKSDEPAALDMSEVLQLKAALLDKALSL